MTLTSWCSDIKPAVELFAWSFITQLPLRSLKKYNRESLDSKGRKQRLPTVLLLFILNYLVCGSVKMLWNVAVVHRLWQSWFISRLISSLFVFINLGPIWVYRHRCGVWRSAEHRDQHRQPVSLSGITDQTPRGALITRCQTISLSSAFICSHFSKCTQMHGFIQPCSVCDQIFTQSSC